MTKPAWRSFKARSGLDPKLAAALAYVFGPIGGAVFLMMEKEDEFVRFHALQSVVTFLGIAVIHLVVAGLPLVAWLRFPLRMATFGVWLFLIVKAFAGARYKVPVVGDFVERQLASRAQ